MLEIAWKLSLRAPSTPFLSLGSVVEFLLLSLSWLLLSSWPKNRSLAHEKERMKGGILSSFSSSQFTDSLSLDEAVEVGTAASVDTSWMFVGAAAMKETLAALAATTAQESNQLHDTLFFCVRIWLSSHKLFGWNIWRKSRRKRRRRRIRRECDNLPCEISTSDMHHSSRFLLVSSSSSFSTHRFHLVWLPLLFAASASAASADKTNFNTRGLAFK